MGIRREDKSVWESRAPLSPSQVGALKNDLGVSVVVQPSKTRVFTDNEYLMVRLKSLPLAKLELSSAIGGRETF